MSQIDPNGHRRSLREVKKTPKQQAIDDQKAIKHQGLARSQVAADVKRQRTQQRMNIESLKAQAQAELDNAEATVRMMYDVGELPGLDSNDPNYELLRKIAHRTGKNYAGQGLSTEELQEILDDPPTDDPEADKTFGKSNISPADRTEDSATRQPDQPDFASYYPGITFGKPENDPKPSTAPSKRSHPTSNNPSSSKKHRVSTDTPPPLGTTTTHASNKSESRKGSVVPPQATYRYSPLTRTDNTTIHGGTPSHPQHPPAPPRRKPTPLTPTYKATIIGGTPTHPLKPLPRASTGLKPVTSHSPPPQSPRPTNPNPTDHQHLPKAKSQPVIAPSVSPPSWPSKVQPPPPESEPFLSRPDSRAPGSHVEDSARQLVPQPSPPPRLPAPNKGKGRALSTDSVTGDSHTTYATGQIQHPKPPSTTISKLETAHNELKAAREAWDLRSHGLADGQPLSPDLAQLATRLRECQYRYLALKEDTPEPSIPQIRSSNGSTSTGTRSLPHSKESKRSSGDVSKISKSKATRPTHNAHIGGSAKTSRSADGPPNTLSPAQISRASSSTNINTSAVARKDAHAPTPSKSSRPNLRNSPRDSLEENQQQEGEDVEDDIGDGQALDDDDDNKQTGNGQPAGQVRSEKEKANKPNLVDFPYDDRRILKLAKFYALAQLLSRGMFKYLPTDKGPKLKHEEYVYKKAWESACQDAKVNRPYRSIFGKWMSQRRSGYINHTTEILKVIVDRHLGFSVEDPQRNISISRARANRGCHMEPGGHAFFSPLVRKGVQALVFELAHPYGIKYPDLFKTIPSRLIAYVCAILHFIINGYRKGPWNNDRLSAKVQGAFFRQFLKDYEKEENASPRRKAKGESYRQKIYESGKLLYEAQQPGEDEPMSPAEGTWSSDMEIEGD
ncbi:hypothetical protein FRC11_009934 [Ceratobasidium sp. 423]|nr:hypothetical protein FRC11_009934 [Ceratobasidium sp. 423]